MCIFCAVACYHLGSLRMFKDPGPVLGQASRKPRANMLPLLQVQAVLDLPPGRAVLHPSLYSLLFSSSVKWGHNSTDL